METTIDPEPAPVPATPDLQRTVQEEKRDLLARLLSHLAHEIRNPLSSLDIHVQLLEEDLTAGGTSLPAPTAERLQIIQGEIRRLENIVTRFLQLAGPSALETQSISLNELVQRTCDLLRPDASERGVELALSLGADLPPVEADPVQLSQALINLVINGLQAAPRQGQVRVSTRQEAEFVAVDIADDGPGIAPEEQAKIFEPYYTTKAEGSGLGLWITQQIVLAHAGTLRLESQAGKGSTFILRLPVRRPVVLDQAVG